MARHSHGALLGVQLAIALLIREELDRPPDPKVFLPSPLPCTACHREGASPTNGDGERLHRDLRGQGHDQSVS